MYLHSCTSLSTGGLDNVPSEQVEGPSFEPARNLHIEGFDEPPKIFNGVKLITFDLVTDWEFANRRIKPFRVHPTMILGRGSSKTKSHPRLLFLFSSPAKPGRVGH